MVALAAACFGLFFGLCPLSSVVDMSEFVSEYLLQWLLLLVYMLLQKKVVLSDALNKAGYCMRP